MNNKKKIDQARNSKKIYTLIGVTILFIGLWYFTFNPGSDGNLDKGINAEISVNTEGDLIIKKSEVTEKVKFYGYEDGDTYMEVIAVKATDGTVRTALNTCQVCFDSGRGYYVQQGDTVVCQNCGNIFKIDDIQVIKGGCNPVPIMEEDKIEDAENITIASSYLSANKEYFTYWKE